MASKGQKFNKYSKELKNEVLNFYKTTKCSQRYLSKKYKIPEGTVSGWLYKTEKGIEISVSHRKGRCGRKSNKNLDYKEKYEILKKFQAFIKARRKKK